MWVLLLELVLIIIYDNNSQQLSIIVHSLCDFTALLEDSCDITTPTNVPAKQWGHNYYQLHEFKLILYNIYLPVRINSNTMAIVGNITAHHHGKKNMCAACVSSTNGYGHVYEESLPRTVKLTMAYQYDHPSCIIQEDCCSNNHHQYPNYSVRQSGLHNSSQMAEFHSDHLSARAIMTNGSPLSDTTYQ